MPRYFFHIRRNGEVIEDGEGMEIPDLDAARDEALASSGDAAFQAFRDKHFNPGDQIEVVNQAGRVVLIFPIPRLV